jgi:linoleoyl-CoA desaturase
VSFEPITFGLGVFALFLSKQVEATEIGHSVLHGAYDGIESAHEFRSKTFFWNVPIDEESWRYGHNVRHHGATNVAGKDPDIHFGPARLTDRTPHNAFHRWQLPFLVLFLAPNFGFFMNWHFTGLQDFYFGNGRPEELDIIPDRSWATFKTVHWRALRKYVKLYAIDYVLFPLLAGPMFWKVMLGNFLASTLRDLYSAATIYCGHVGDEVESYPEGTKAEGRGAFYIMQIAATNNFKVSLPVSILCGGLDLQIEHHLFPRLPPNRLREVAPEVRAACERHGIPYRSESWGTTLLGALRHVRQLSVA